jgi:hypothetical protein
MGFMDELEADLQEYAGKEKVYYGSVNQAIREYTKELESQVP